MLLGMSTATCAVYIQEGIMDLNRYDTVSLHGVWRVTRVHPYTRKKVKAVRWLDLDGASEIPQENRVIRSLYRKKMQEYWRTSDPLLLKQAMSMTKYANSPVPNEGACDFLGKARGPRP